MATMISVLIFPGNGEVHSENSSIYIGYMAISDAYILSYMQ